MKTILLSLTILTSIPASLALASEPDQQVDHRATDKLAKAKERAHKRTLKAQERADKARARAIKATKRAELAARKASEARAAEQTAGQE